MRIRERFVRYLLKHGLDIGLNRKEGIQFIIFGILLTVLAFVYAFWTASQHELFKYPLFYGNILMFMAFWVIWNVIGLSLPKINKLRGTLVPAIILGALVWIGAIYIPKIAVKTVSAIYMWYGACGILIGIIVYVTIYKLVRGEIERGSIKLDGQGKPILE